MGDDLHYQSRAALALRAGDATEFGNAVAVLCGSLTKNDAEAAMSTIAEIRAVVASSSSARALLLKSDALVTGLAGALKPLCALTCLPVTSDDDASKAAALESLSFTC